eukprot:CAMPEP_0177756822 /NCGR_PEP_ID=MMETSP0491_2-20121128/3315_1 /TAXON_ID=63592 /ORGANISM="Tetraselmis chuii, Strain PLY429" /LENGTH=216 /DNA_ID=CAMNT_0019272433 /DNA_START=115 /DNA_END=765 /DNA_ORIENTATION=+
MRPLALAVFLLAITSAFGQETENAPTDGAKKLVGTASFPTSLPFNEEQPFRDGFVNILQAEGGEGVTAEDITITDLDVRDGRTKVEFDISFSSAEPAFVVKNALLGEGGGMLFGSLGKGPATMEDVKVHEQDEVSEVEDGYVAMAAVLSVMFCLVVIVCVVNVLVIVFCCCCRNGKQSDGPVGPAVPMTASQPQAHPYQQRVMQHEPDYNSRREPA